MTLPDAAPAGPDGPPVRLFIVDGQPLFRVGVRALFAGRSDYFVCGETGTLADARRLCRRLGPALVLLDPDLPDGDGLALLEESRGWSPRVRVLVLSNRLDGGPESVSAMRRGAAGVISKAIAGTTLVAVLASVCRGETHLNPAMVAQLARRVRGPRVSKMHPAI